MVEFVESIVATGTMLRSFIYPAGFASQGGGDSIRMQQWLDGARRSSKHIIFELDKLKN
jgi:hypothetical protein